jgi:hypothetical protein
MKNLAERLSLPGRAMLDRRQFLGSTGSALGSIALLNLLARDRLLGADRVVIDPAKPFGHFLRRGG